MFRAIAKSISLIPLECSVDAEAELFDNVRPLRRIPNHIALIFRQDLRTNEGDVVGFPFLTVLEADMI